MSVTTRAADPGQHREMHGRPFAPGAFAWISAYRRRAVVIDFGSSLAAGALAAHIRFTQGSLPTEYLVLTCALPLLWCTAVLLAGGYDARFIGLGSD